MEMNCAACGSKWTITDRLTPPKECPFCGAPLPEPEAQNQERTSDRVPNLEPTSEQAPNPEPTSEQAPNPEPTDSEKQSRLAIHGLKGNGASSTARAPENKQANPKAASAAAAPNRKKAWQKVLILLCSIAACVIVTCFADPLKTAFESPSLGSLIWAAQWLFFPLTIWQLATWKKDRTSDMNLAWGISGSALALLYFSVLYDVHLLLGIGWMILMLYCAWDE